MESHQQQEISQQEKLHQFILEMVDLLKCPITGQIFSNPVVAQDMHTYENTALQYWFVERIDRDQPVTSPLTNQVINTNVVQNHIVKKMVCLLLETDPKYADLQYFDISAIATDDIAKSINTVQKFIDLVNYYITHKLQKRTPIRFDFIETIDQIILDRFKQYGFTVADKHEMMHQLIQIIMNARNMFVDMDIFNNTFNDLNIVDIFIIACKLKNIDTIAMVLNFLKNIYRAESIKAVLSILDTGKICKTLLDPYYFQLDIFKYMVENGLDINYSYIHDGMNVYTPLMYAIKNDMYDLIDYIISDTSCDINLDISEDADGIATALELACSYLDAEVIAKLIDSGANVNACDSLVKTILNIAETSIYCNTQSFDDTSEADAKIVKKAYTCIKILCDNGYQIGPPCIVKNPYGEPCYNHYCDFMYMFAYNVVSIELIELFISKGFDINAKDDLNGCTPIYLLCSNHKLTTEHIDMIRIMITKYDADFTCRPYDSDDFTREATKCGQSCYKLIMQHVQNYHENPKLAKACKKLLPLLTSNYHKSH